MDNNNSTKVVTRFAPSPTGFMHIGGVRTALFAYFFARQNNGTFILRIEDTDKSREVEGSINHIQDSLRWLNMDWDYGPEKPGPFGSCIQSERLDTYLHYAQKLIDKGLAYADSYTEAEIESFREQAKSENRPFLFRNHRPENTEPWDGTRPLRLRVPEVKRYTWQDAVRGELSAGEEMLDDVILIKSDGFPTYNFAHIVDDFEMGVTHIFRADEFIASVPKFLSIYDALGIPYPTFATLPPILRDDRTKKLGKRDGAKDILDYKTEGYLPEAMVNFLSLIGWNPGTEQEIFETNELIREFSVSKIQRAGAAFNEEKLRWMNKEHLSRLSADEFSAYISIDLPNKLTSLPDFDEGRFSRLVPNIRERVSTRADFHEFVEAGEYDYFFSTPEYDPEILKWKNDETVAVAKPRLIETLDLLKNTDFSSPESVKNALWGYAESVGRGEVLWPLRVALSGQKQSPDPFTLAYILGSVETLARLKTACDKISA